MGSQRSMGWTMRWTMRTHRTVRRHGRMHAGRRAMWTKIGWTRGTHELMMWWTGWTPGHHMGWGSRTHHARWWWTRSSWSEGER